MKKYVGKYQVDETFKVTGRGVIFAGIVLDGSISKGNSIEFEFNQQRLERIINGIEGIKSVNAGSNTGLLIECINDLEISHLSEWNPNNTICSVYQINEQDKH